jgi:hypothetical protein
MLLQRQGEEKIMVPAKETAIAMFPKRSDLPIKLQACFGLHHFKRIMQLQQAIKGKV